MKHMKFVVSGKKISQATIEYYKAEVQRNSDLKDLKLSPLGLKLMADSLFKDFGVPPIEVIPVVCAGRPAESRYLISSNKIHIDSRMMDACTLAHEFSHYVQYQINPVKRDWHGQDHLAIMDLVCHSIRGSFGLKPVEAPPSIYPNMEMNSFSKESVFNKA